MSTWSVFCWNLNVSSWIVKLMITPTTLTHRGWARRSASTRGPSGGRGRTCPCWGEARPCGRCPGSSWSCASSGRRRTLPRQTRTAEWGRGRRPCHSDQTFQRRWETRPSLTQPIVFLSRPMSGGWRDELRTFTRKSKLMVSAGPPTNPRITSLSYINNTARRHIFLIWGRGGGGWEEGPDPEAVNWGLLRGAAVGIAWWPQRRSGWLDFLQPARGLSHTRDMAKIICTFPSVQKVTLAH